MDSWNWDKRKRVKQPGSQAAREQETEKDKVREKEWAVMSETFLRIPILHRETMQLVVTVGIYCIWQQ